MPIKQPLTPEKANKVHFSLQKMAIMAQMMLLEQQTELVDTDFRVPYINNFAKRIISDCKTINTHLATSGRLIVKVVDRDFLEDYSGSIWRVVTLLAGMDMEIVDEFVSNLEKELEEILN